MASKDEFDEVLENMLEQAKKLPFGCVSIKAGALEKAHVAHFGHQSSGRTPMACAAIRRRFRPGKDFFRVGKGRGEWLSEISLGDDTSTFEVLFEVNR